MVLFAVLLAASIVGLVGVSGTNNTADGGELITRASCNHPSTTVTYTALSNGTEHRITVTCSVCGTQLYSSALSHTYVATIYEATCTMPVRVNVKCSYCTYSRTETHSSPLGHDYFEFSNTPATCTTAGEKVSKCSRCDEAITETFAALGHSYGDWSNVGPTEDNRLLQRRICSVCNDTQEQTITPGSHCHHITIESNTFDHLVLTTTIYANQATTFSTMQEWLDYLLSVNGFDYLVCSGSVRYYDADTKQWYTANVTKVDQYSNNMFTYYYADKNGVTVTVRTTVEYLTITDTV